MVTMGINGLKKYPSAITSEDQLMKFWGVGTKPGVGHGLGHGLGHWVGHGVGHVK